jgi:hypothetical protein
LGGAVLAASRKHCRRDKPQALYEAPPVDVDTSCHVLLPSLVRLHVSLPSNIDSPYYAIYVDICQDDY